MSENAELPAPVFRALVRAGWSPDRRWDTRGAAAAHEARGLTLHDAARAFLSRYGGLTVGRGLLCTDAESALAGVDDSQLQELRQWVGEELAVVGTADGGRALLLVSERGALWAAKGDIVLSHGTEIEHALSRYCPADTNPLLN